MEEFDIYNITGPTWIAVSTGPESFEVPVLVLGNVSHGSTGAAGYNFVRSGGDEWKGIWVAPIRSDVTYMKITDRSFIAELNESLEEVAENHIVELQTIIGQCQSTALVMDVMDR